MTTTVGRRHSARAVEGKPNIVLILTDDQRAGTLQYMPNVTSLLVDQGTEFTDVFDNNPLCCPSRATILTGQTSGHTGVWSNIDSSIGGFQAFKPHADQTVMKWMHDAGYRTGLIGKFLNGYSYPDGDAAWVLPGVDEWDAFLLEPINQSHNGCDQLGYWATCYSHNGTLEKHGPDEYSTTTSGDKAVQFIDSTPAGQPLFLYYAPRAPHLPTLPDTKYANACPTLPKLHPPSFNTQIVNAPAYMQRPPFSKKLQKFFAKKWLADCQTLLSVDDQVGNIVAGLQDTGRLDNTLIMFASDNGWLFGEHRWKGKIVPYQEADQVPVIIRWDALGRQPAQVGDLVTNMDYTATFLDAAGASPPAGYQLDGQSMLPLIGGGGAWQQENAVLVEHAGGKQVPPYCGVRTDSWLFAQYATGEFELYDEVNDPYQLVNVAADHPDVVAQLRAQTQQLCQPLPPKFHW